MEPTEMPSLSSGFDAKHSADIVNARMAAATSPRLRQIMAAAVEHLHAFVKEVQVTHAEWSAAIEFLTETGQTCNAYRQEFILLSDVLGVSMLVDAINQSTSAEATESSVLGPFHVAMAPSYENGTDICLDGKGAPVFVHGRVTDRGGYPIAGAELDVWQANDEGFYDVQQPDVQPEWNLRGRFITGSDGRYSFRSAKPRYYPIPSDGPVGKMLAAVGRHPYRAAHLHFIVRAPGFRGVTTQIFTPDCPYLREDAVFGVKKSLVADFEKLDAADDADTRYRVEWDFLLDEEV